MIGRSPKRKATHAGGSGNGLSLPEVPLSALADQPSADVDERPVCPRLSTTEDRLAEASHHQQIC